ncbi:MAG: 30S ribosomal protein S8 [Deltaproteobacteria bacterium RIFCSPLOWO2_02_FULL_53_8]|nr:MAG: 30S ribosomal protein S8 [Deltaproteobacteria bacterium RIFCSPLOWO2_02_FULL_53_8]
MSMTDPIADLLTRVRNAIQAKKREVVLPASSIKHDIAKILKEEGYIKDVSLIKEDKRSFLKLQLKYSAAKKGVITRIKRVSKPGLRRYEGADSLPKVLNGVGIAIISTSKGVMTDKKARELGVGGEVLCTLY